MLIHEQVTLPNAVGVDAGLAKVLTALWQLGLTTSYSCQGSLADARDEVRPDSAAYILFPEAADALTFFGRALEAMSTPERKARIVVDVRMMTKAGVPGWERLKRGPAVSLELDVDPSAKARGLRGCVRFDPELLPQVEAAFSADG